MTTLEINNIKIGLVRIPDDAYDFSFDKGGYLLMKLKKSSWPEDDFYPDEWIPGDYTIIGKASEIDDKEILEQVKAHNLNPETTLVVKIN